MSKYSTQVGKFLEDVFPNYRVRREKYIVYQNTELLFDYFLPEFKLYIEVQGQQHYSFNKFFHKDRKDFDKQLVRDKLKTAWIAETGNKLLVLKYSELENMTPQQFKARVLEML